MYKCPFCNGNDCIEVKKIPRGRKRYTAEDKEVQILKNKYLHEMKCSSCGMTFMIDKDLYINRE